MNLVLILIYKITNLTPLHFKEKILKIFKEMLKTPNLTQVNNSHSKTIKLSRIKK